MPRVVEQRRLGRTALLRLLDALGPGGPGAVTLCLPPGVGADAVASRLPGALLEALGPPVAGVVAGSETGAVLLWEPSSLRLVLPPFPPRATLVLPGLQRAPLDAILSSTPRTAVVLVRLGRFAVGVYEGDRLLASKTDRRYVKGRHRAGGSSANRFRRIREKQAERLFEVVCREVRDRLGPYEGEIEHLFLGGEGSTLSRFRERCPYLARFDGVLRRRTLDVREPGQEALERLPGLLWESTLYESMPSPEGRPTSPPQAG